ncbi:hypothetical protein R80B4_01087 [Fibrobacteres bacterium R8-0-B4]
MYKRITLILLTLCPLLIVCGDDCTYKLKYEVTGTAPRGGVSVLIVNEYGDDEEFSSIRLPWVKEFEVQFRDDTYYGGKFTSGIFPAYVSAKIKEYGGVTVKIYYSGDMADSASASGRDGTATARYGVRLR